MVSYRLIYGDVIDSLRLIYSQSVDLIVTSPPYNVHTSYSEDPTNDWIPWPDYYAWCEQWLSECYRVLKPDGRILINHYFSLGSAADGRSYPLMKLNSIAVETLKFEHHAVIFWADDTVSKRTAWGSWLSASAPYVSSPYEGILVLYKGPWKRERRGVTNISKEEFMEGTLGIWRIPAGRSSDSQHPCPFPSRLTDRAVKLFSFEGDTVLDPFCGSGQVLISAYTNGRSAIGIDQSSEYIEALSIRLESL